MHFITCYYLLFTLDELLYTATTGLKEDLLIKILFSDNK